MYYNGPLSQDQPQANCTSVSTGVYHLNLESSVLTTGGSGRTISTGSSGGAYATYKDSPLKRTHSDKVSFVLHFTIMIETSDVL